MSHKENNGVDIFDLIKPKDDSYPVERLRLGLLLETLQSYANVNRRIRANPDDEKAHALADILENQLTIAAACIYVSIPKEDRSHLSKSAMLTVMNKPDSLPTPPDLEELN